MRRPDCANACQSNLARSCGTDSSFTTPGSSPARGFRRKRSGTFTRPVSTPLPSFVSIRGSPPKTSKPPWNSNRSARRQRRARLDAAGAYSYVQSAPRSLTRRDNLMRLEDLLKASREVEMTEADREAQRRSFAYGNTKIDNDLITWETVDRAAEQLNIQRDDRR